MIIEPVPTGPRSRPRRALGRLALALPVLLLALVIGAGMVGRPATRVAAAPSPVPGAPSAPIAVDAPDAGDQPVVDPGFPRVIDDLAVHLVPEVLAARASGTTLGLLAVAGYLSVPRPPSDCDDGAPGPLGPLGPLCERRALLSQQPRPSAGGDRLSGLGPHLHVSVPVGVWLPAAIARTMSTTTGSPLRVVMIGRFAPLPAGGCSAAGVRCDQGFEADAVAWAEGDLFPSRPVIDAGIDGNPADRVLRHRAVAETRAVGRTGTVLVSALVRPSTLPQIDREAAAALADGAPDGSPRGLVWYVRGLVPADDPTRYPLGQSPSRLRWVLLDDATGATIARGGDSQPVP